MSPRPLAHRIDLPRLSRRALLLALAGLPAGQTSAAATRTSVASVADFSSALAFLAGRHPNVLVYISARWCPICTRIDTQVLPAEPVREALRHVPLLKVDVTAMDGAARALLRLLAATGPPTLFVADARARAERPGTRFVGDFSEQALLERLGPFAG